MEEITIVGGGLAGLSLAVGLRGRGVPVRVHEAGAYPRHRVCGEFISGVTASTLEALGIRADLEDARRNRSMCWHRQGEVALEGELPEPALAISRHLLDHRLRDRVVTAGGRVFEHSRKGPEAAAGRVWAAGRRARSGEWIGLKCHVAGFKARADLEMHLGGNGYAGVARLDGDGRVNVCGLFRLDRSRAGRGSDLLLNYLRDGGNRGLAERLVAADRDERSFLGVAGFSLGWQADGDGMCRIGDAEGMIPPFTGNGMSMALESAELALGPLVDWSRGRRGWEETVEAIRGQTRRRFRRRVASAMAMHRLLLSGRGQRLIEGLSRAGLLPMRPLLALVR